ncbi:MAG: VWA domain-containing protein [Candidatus Acidiferrales bacterium]
MWNRLATSVGTAIVCVFAALTLSAQLSAPNSPGPASQTPPSAPAQSAPPANPPQPAAQGGAGAVTIPVVVNLVDVQFTVVNRRQKLVTDLQKENFRVLDDGVAQAIQSFSRQTDLPLRIGLLLDTSNSIRERLQFEQDAAVDFLYNVVRRGRDLAFVMTFDDQPEIVQDYTDNLDELQQSIRKQRAGGATALYDAVYEACANKLLHAPMPANQPVIRRVLVVISDGDDNLSQKSRSQAIEVAQRVGAVIYTISTSTEWLTPEESSDPTKLADRKYHKEGGDLVLQALADTAGGRAFFPYRVDDLNQSFLDIGEELRSQYSIAWAPIGRQADGKYHTIAIQVDQKDLIIRARAGYYGAPPALRKGSVVPTTPASPATAPPPPPGD